MLKHTVLILNMLLFLFIKTTAQNALVFNNDAYIVMNGGSSATPAYLVVNQPNANGITTQGTGGNIISENEYNYVKWMVGTTSTGTFTVPFTTGALSNSTEQKIPLSMQITTAGAGSGDFLFSTYETDDNNLPWASGVTHFQSATGIVDNKDWVVDRFWIIDAENYSTKPSAQLSFGFNDDATEVGTPNLLNPTNLGAQRFNTSNNHWEGTANGLNGIWGTVTGTPGNRSVSGVNTPGSDFYRVWTLTDYSNPLPVNLVYFNAECYNGKNRLEWLLENDATHFDVERSSDGIHFSKIGTVFPSNGNTNQQFTFIDNNPLPTINYYRLVMHIEEDFGYSNTITLSTCDEDNDISVFSPVDEHLIYVQFKQETSKNYDFFLYDVSGRLIFSQKIVSLAGVNQFVITPPSLATGIYNVVLTDNLGNKVTTKVVL